MGFGAEILTLMATVALGCATAAFIVLWLARETRSGKAPMPYDNARPAPEPAIFVFSGCSLIDMTDPGMLSDRDPDGPDSDDWQMVARHLCLRFPDIPATPGQVPEGEAELVPVSPRDPGVLRLSRQGDTIRLVLPGDDQSGTSGAMLHLLQNALAELRMMRDGLKHTPNPIWARDHDGRIIWANKAYFSLATTLGFEPDKSRNRLPELFKRLDPEPQGFTTRRDCLTAPGGDRKHWYDIFAIDAEPRCVNFALNVDTVIDAEIAQRNFVQTLTKTFAHLSIGLAIFNRDRQLALFNPALVDLTELPVDFLSGRPTIKCFFDLLRENRMMPEPKNYSSWRERIGTLVAAATDGSFLETWSLASGQTYRVTGRPHPDGAVAFLFEDISHEVSLTRSFRSELALGNAVLDQMDTAMAVFTADGILAFSNADFRTLWSVDPDRSFADTTIADALAVWRQRSLPDAPWDRVEAALIDAHRLDGAQVPMMDGSIRICRVRPLINGARLVMFAQTTAAAQPTMA
jgi:PAS domain-containing protein